MNDFERELRQAKADAMGKQAQENLSHSTEQERIERERRDGEQESQRLSSLREAEMDSILFQYKERVDYYVHAIATETWGKGGYGFSFKKGSWHPDYDVAYWEVGQTQTRRVNRYTAESGSERWESKIQSPIDSFRGKWHRIEVARVAYDFVLSRNNGGLFFRERHDGEISNGKGVDINNEGTLREYFKSVFVRGPYDSRNRPTDNMFGWSYKSP